MPGQPNFFGISFQAVGAKEPMTGRAVITDDQYLSTLNLQMAQGRFFSKQLATDSLSLVINEKAVAELGLKQPVGARLTTPDGQLNLPDGTPHIYTVIGVVKDFHFQSLHQKITPLVFINSSKFGNINPVMAVRIEAPEFKTAVTGIEKTWKRFVSQRPFHYNFLDEQLANLYHSEKNSQRLFSIFSALAIFIACMGLLGLVTYAIQQRVREIGIRKVLGAGIGSIITMLSKDFLKLIFIAIIISTPLAWWAMHKWLQDFAYRITINWGVFVIAGVVALLIALFTVSLQAIKAAVANPVKSLRME